MSEYFIPRQLLKLLVDSKAEARQKGAREVGSIAAAVFQKHPSAEAYEIIASVVCEVEINLLRMTSPAYRRGGLSAIRAIVCSFPPEKNHPSEIVTLFSNIVFESVVDLDATVRLAAFEAAHVLVRQLRVQLLEICFTRVFCGIATGINDNDRRVVVLAREVSLTLRELVPGNGSYTLPMDLFVTFITESLTPYISAQCNDIANAECSSNLPLVQWCLEWIDYVLDLPGDGLILYFWRLLKPLLFFSGTYGGGEVLPLLQKCLRDIKDAFFRQVNVQLSNLFSIAAECVKEAEIFLTKKIALEWIMELLNIDTDELVQLMHKAVMVSLSELGSKDLGTRLAAQNVNNRLVQIISTQSVVVTSVSYEAILKTVSAQLTGRGTEETRVASLEWIALVHHFDPTVVECGFKETFDTVLLLLCDQSPHVVHKCIECLCLISGERHFDYFIAQIVDLFHAKADVLLPRAPKIIKQLQLRYQNENLDQSEKLCLKLASVLSMHEDKRFLEKVVITLSTMVLTSKEFLPLREILHRGVGDERALKTFVGMYKCWRYNTVAALSLCLLSRVYEHALQLIKLLGAAELSAGTLLQLERLARLIEAPVFAYIRIALIEPSKCLPLVQTLFAIQLILPQGSPQYLLLYRRLKTIPSLARLECEARRNEEVRKEDVNLDELLELTKEAQQCVSDFERKLFLQRLGDANMS